MKKTIIITALLIAGLGAAEANNTTERALGTYSNPDWKKSKEGTWKGANDTWYKLNPKDASLWMSKDGKKWEASKDGMWQDKDGKWLKIVDKDLKWSADEGASWSSVPEWKWQGHDGKWYKFDKDWTLWTA